MNKNYSDQQKKLIKKMALSVQTDEFISTVVPMRPDYEDDNRICLTSVVFPTKKINNFIESQIIKPLKNIEPNHHYYPASSLHITIKNIRTIANPPLFSQKDARKVSNLLKIIVPECVSFDFNFEDIVRFPTSLSLIGYSDERLRVLIQKLDNGLKKIGVPDNKKYFSNSIFFGSMTLCRFTQQPSIKFLNKVAELRTVKIAPVEVKTISLITCNAVCDARGRKIIGEYSLR